MEISIVNYYNTKRKKDYLSKIKTNVSGLVSNSLNFTGKKKNSKVEKILGCKITDFKFYIESKFETWMNWENKGLYNGELNNGWDLDHIIPLSSAKTTEDIIRLNHYTNLQPLCSKINRDIKKDNSSFNIDEFFDKNKLINKINTLKDKIENIENNSQPSVIFSIIDNIYT